MCSCDNCDFSKCAFCFSPISGTKLHLKLSYELGEVKNKEKSCYINEDFVETSGSPEIGSPVGTVM